jgi:hypothetical protein
MVLLAVPWDKVPETLASLPKWKNQILIDGTNPFHGQAGNFRPAKEIRQKAARQMPIIDVYAVAGTFPDKHRLAQDLANAVMRWEKVPPINHFKFKKNIAAFVHDLLAEAISNAVGDSHYVGVQVPTEGAIHVMGVRVADEALAEPLANIIWNALYSLRRNRARA